MSNDIPTESENPLGLHKKYIIQHADGRPVDPSAEYFVLRLDDGGDDMHIDACRAALRTYARRIKRYFPKLADDLQERYGLETNGD